MAAFVELVIVPDVNDAAAVPLDIPERPVTTGAVHVYLVLLGTMSFVLTPPPLDGVVDVDVPEQIDVRSMAAIDGLGLTVTDTSNVSPVQSPDIGVTVYVTVMAAFVEFTSVPVENVVVALAIVALDMPERPATVGASHE
jgi:hypothetical protein